MNNLKGFSAVSEKEMLEVNGGEFAFYSEPCFDGLGGRMSVDETKKLEPVPIPGPPDPDAPTVILSNM